MGKTARAQFTRIRGKNADAVANPLYNIFGVLWQKDWVIARTLAFEKLHSMEEGVCMQILLLIVQQPQRIHESDGEAVSAVSPAAAFADSVLSCAAESLYTIMLGMPTERRHS